MSLTATPADRLLPWRQVKDLTGLSRTTAWRLQKAGDFPLPVLISPGRVGWREHEIAAWKASRTPRAAQPPRSFAAEKEPPAAQPQPMLIPDPPRSVMRQPPAAKRRSRRTSPPNQMTLDF